MDVAAAFSGIAQQFSATFGAGYHPGVASKSTDPVLDDGGSIVTPGAPVAMDCLVQVDAVTEAMRRTEGFRDTDMRLLVLAHGLAEPIDTDMVIDVLEGPHAGAWRVATVQRDPAGVYFECLGRRA